MNVDDFNFRIVFQMFPEFGNVNIHTTGIEIIIVDPNGFQGKVAFQNLVGIVAKQAEQFGFFGG
jgi:hypothetical protein